MITAVLNVIRLYSKLDSTSEIPACSNLLHKIEVYWDSWCSLTLSSSAFPLSSSQTVLFVLFPVLFVLRGVSGAPFWFPALALTPKHSFLSGSWGFWVVFQMAWDAHAYRGDMCSNSAISRPLPVRVWKKLLHPQSCSLMAPPWQGRKHKNTQMDAPSNQWGWSSSLWIPLLALGLVLLLPCSGVVSILYSRKALCISLRTFISPHLGCRFHRNPPWLYSSMRWKKHSSLEKQMYNSPNFRNYCWNSACAQFRESKTLGSWCLQVSQVPVLPFQSMKIQSIEPALFSSVKMKGELNALWMSVIIRTVSGKLTGVYALPVLQA